MNEVAHKRFKFGQAAYGIGVTEKTLRNWLQRGQVDLVTERGPDDAHYSFAIADLVVLSVVAELVRYGCPVRTAYDGLDPLRRHFSMLSMFKNAPFAAAAAALVPMQIFVTNQHGVWNIKLLQTNTPQGDAGDDEKIGSFLVVDPAFCMGEVLRRIREQEETREALAKISSPDEADRLMAYARNRADLDLEFKTVPAKFTTPE
jgi:hypothetical protein